MSEEELMRRLRGDLLDGFDEELEMELEDRNIDAVAGVLTDSADGVPFAFTDDLDIDSISMMTIVVNAEEKFGVRIPDEEVKNLLGDGGRKDITRQLGAVVIVTGRIGQRARETAVSGQGIGRREDLSSEGKFLALVLTKQGFPCIPHIRESSRTARPH